MNAQEAIAYIHSNHWENSQPGLHRIRTLLERLGNPQKEMRFVHVGGTNGKGSTCACMAAVLRQSGYRVGLNTSPYLLRFHERIQVDGVQISDDELVSLVERVRPVAQAMPERPTEFELITAMAMLHFQEKRCHIVVLEVGLGGELDASNVIEVPEVAVLTAMGLDHMRELGPTLTDIATAKAGIIKPGGAVVSYGGCGEADAVFRRVCAAQRAALTEVDFTRLTGQDSRLEGSGFDFRPYRALRLPLVGLYQLYNAATAITALEVLAGKGWAVSEGDIRSGLAAVQWPGRFEVLRREPLVLLDGAHNPHGMAATAESLRLLLPDGKAVFLVGVLGDKDAAQMMTEIAPMAAAFVAVRPENVRAMAAAELETILRRLGPPVQSCGTVEEGVRAAAALAGATGAVCAVGSLYFSGDVRRAVAQIFA